MEKLLGASATASGQDCMTFFNSQAQTIRTPLGVLLLSRQIPRMGIFFFFSGIYQLEEHTLLQIPNTRDK